MLALSLLLGALPGIHAHAVLTMPASRNGGSMRNPANYQSTMYYTAPARTSATHVIGQNSPYRTEFRYYAGDHPWRAPGTADIWSPCGMYCDNCQSPGGTDGRKLTATQKTVWQAGDAVEVAFGMNTNHGGGYSYRLCPADSDLSEECFAQNYLDFVGDTTWVQMRDDKSKRTAIKAKRTNLGAGGSMWTMCPVPNNCNGADCAFPPPMQGLYGHTHQTNTRMLEEANFVDKVRIPASLPSGDYVLSFRLDCEETAQVWSNCADVTIVGGTGGGGGGGSKPRPNPVPEPEPEPEPNPPSSGNCQGCLAAPSDWKETCAFARCAGCNGCPKQTKCENWCSRAPTSADKSSWIYCAGCSAQASPPPAPPPPPPPPPPPATTSGSFCCTWSPGGCDQCEAHNIQDSSSWCGESTSNCATCSGTWCE